MVSVEGDKVMEKRMPLYPDVVIDCDYLNCIEIYTNNERRFINFGLYIPSSKLGISIYTIEDPELDTGPGGIGID